MNFEAFYPNHSLLIHCIEYYYFQKSDNDVFSAEYYAFPNTVLALNIHRNICYNINGHKVSVTGVKQENYLMLLNGRYQLPLHVQQKGDIDKVTIVFKPLGLNHFIKTSFNEVARHPTQIFTAWNDINTPPFLNRFFKEQDNNKRIAVLENYLLSFYEPFPEYSFLNEVLNMLCDFDREVSIEEVAKKFSLSSRTFNRVFKKHLGISPVSFRKIARFRHSVKNKLFKSKFDSLTKIGYDSNFYDQSYFNKVYKNLTQQNPRAFFDSVEKLADERLIFQFIQSKHV
ncbi:MAG: helix-turn-helix domain-containing protein [Chitinophagaceae bacterium]